MKLFFLGFFGGVLFRVGCVGVLGVTTESAWAVEVSAGGEDNCTKDYLGFRPWFYDKSGKICSGGNIMQPEKNEEALKVFIWTIVLNISFDLTLAVGYIAVAMVIYGGYLYIMAQGDPGKAAKGQHTLISAVIGVVIAMGASVIVNTLQIVLGLTSGLPTTVSTASQIQGIFSWAYAMAGLVAVVFIIKGGVEYMISRGDPGRVQKATRSLVYAVVGLIIVILASVITNVVMSSIGGAL